MIRQAAGRVSKPANLRHTRRRLAELLTQYHVHRRGIGLIVQLACALCAGGLLALTLGPLLVGSSQFNITSASLWKDLSKAQAGIIGVGSLLSLLAIWTHNFRGHKKH